VEAAGFEDPIRLRELEKPCFTGGCVLEDTEANPLAGGVAARIALSMELITPVTPASEIDGRTVSAPAEPVKLLRVEAGPLLAEVVMAWDGRDEATTEIPAIFLAATALAL
tara:strand:- start:248 stop:580 length:333 start_codon:yes stop_codon:yes gene_type:complete